MTRVRARLFTYPSLSAPRPLRLHQSRDYSRPPCDLEAARLKERKMEGELDMPQAVRTTTATSSKEQVAVIAESIMLKGMMQAVDDGLLENVDFDECLSQ